MTKNLFFWLLLLGIAVCVAVKTILHLGSSEDVAFWFGAVLAIAGFLGLILRRGG